MNKIKTTLKWAIMTLVILMISFDTIKAQDDVLQEKFYRAYVQNSKTMWTLLIDELRSQYDAAQNDMQLLYLLTKAQIGIVNASMADRDKPTYKKYIKDIDDNTKRLIESDVAWSDAYVLRSRMYSAKMAFHPMRSMFLGPKSDKAIENALKHGPENPEAWMVEGGSKFFTPAMFGGDIEEAIQAYSKAIELFKEARGGVKSNPEYLEACAWLGQAYVKNDKYQEAVNVYNEALDQEPDFGWIKYVLLPEAKAKL